MLCTVTVQPTANPARGYASPSPSLRESTSPSTMVHSPRVLFSLRRLPLSLVPSTRRIPQSRHVSLSPLPRPSPYSRRSFRRPAFWLLPVVGGISIYFYPTHQPILSQFFSSSTSAPCPSHEPPTHNELLILSPSELHLSLSERICSFFLDRIWEPILTARRFIHLFFLFAPVILSSPMLLVGSSEERLQGDRWGAVWWYDHLVAQMDRAGPTFIKVRNTTPLFGVPLTSHLLAACPMGSLTHRLVSHFVVRTYGQDAFPGTTAFSCAYEACHRARLPEVV